MFYLSLDGFNEINTSASHLLPIMANIDLNLELQARMLEAIQTVEAESAMVRNYLFAWEDESDRATVQPIEFHFDMFNSDKFNHCFTPRPIYKADYMKMINVFRGLNFIVAMKRTSKSFLSKRSFLLFTAFHEKISGLSPSVKC